MNPPLDLPCALNVTAHVDHRFGGLTTSLPAFCRSIAGTGRYSSALAAFCLPGEAFVEGDARDIALRRFPLGRLRWALDRRAWEPLGELAGRAAAIHIHGIWQEHCWVTARLASRRKKPYIVSAHGMLEPWALRNRRWKKQVYWRLAERRNLEGAFCLRALTAAEAEHFRAAGLRGPAAVIPNGVDIPPVAGAEEFLEKFPGLRGRKLLLFLGRIHPKKGLDLLLRAWAAVHGDERGAHLVIAGPGGDDTVSGLRALVSRLDLGRRVTFTGMLNGAEKWAALRAAHAFVLPSHSEGFSMAALEALGAGTPVILSPQCYFPEVRRAGCGWIADPSAGELEEALRECLQLPAAERGAMGGRAERLVRERYSWSVIGRQTADLLDWARGGAKPRSFEIIE